MKESSGLIIAGVSIAPGETKDAALKIGETYTGLAVSVPLRVFRAPRPGPVVLLTGAIHGDELVGTGIIREVMLSKPALTRGALVCIPIVNLFGFENHSRYLPDRRDLNRSFPGAAKGSMTHRLAHALFTGVVSKCDCCIDFHTAAVRRTNFPHVRGDLGNPEVKRIAAAFGCELVVHKPGGPATLRAVATAGGCATILYEAGEVLKFEPRAIQLGTRGVWNVLKSLGMMRGLPVRPAVQWIANKTVWVRAASGGILRFRVRPGEKVEKGQLLAVCEGIFAGQAEGIVSPVAGVVVGMTTLPAVKPGEPVCHIAVPEKSSASRRTAHSGARKPPRRRVPTKDSGVRAAVEESRKKP